MIKLSSRRSGKNRVLHCSFQDAHCIQLASASRTHNLSMTAWLFCWGKSPAILQNTHTREKSFYQHAWFMSYRTHVMTTWLFVEGSPLRYCKIPIPVKKVFISMRGLCVTWRMSWLLGYLLREVLCDIAKCPWPWKEFLSAYVVYQLLDTHYDTLFTLWCMSTNKCSVSVNKMCTIWLFDASHTSRNS